jgi:molecular chaperone HtpG
MRSGRAPRRTSRGAVHEFYKQISHDFEDPLAHTHNRVEGSTEYTQLLYIPAKAPFDLWNRDKKGGLKLYVKRVFIMDDAEALLPTYLRFVKGVVDSADLPLNVSRELLQESRDVRAIREGCTKRVLSMLEDLARNDVPPKAEPGGDGVTDVVSEEDKAAAATNAGKYSKFYAEFGAVLKEGLGEDFANKDRLAKLLRYASSTTDSVSVSLADYKARMKEGQEAIYYITADTLAAARNSPQLEVFKKKGIEVLLMTDRVDEWALNYLHDFDGTPLQSVAKGAVDLGKLQDEAEKKAAEEAAEAFKPVLARLKEALKDKAEDVRVTTRLVDSPACLVVKDHGMSTQLARMLKQAGQTAPDVKPVLEVNAEHALVKKLDGSVHFHDLATSCSTRPCWPRAACRTIRPPMCDGSTRCWSEARRKRQAPQARSADLAEQRFHVFQHVRTLGLVASGASPSCSPSSCSMKHTVMRT